MNDAEFFARLAQSNNDESSDDSYFQFEDDDDVEDMDPDALNPLLVPPKPKKSSKKSKFFKLLAAGVISYYGGQFAQNIINDYPYTSPPPPPRSDGPIVTEQVQAEIFSPTLYKAPTLMDDFIRYAEYQVQQKNTFALNEYFESVADLDFEAKEDLYNSLYHNPDPEIQSVRKNPFFLPSKITLQTADLYQNVKSNLTTHFTSVKPSEIETVSNQFTRLVNYADPPETRNINRRALLGTVARLHQKQGPLTPGFFETPVGQSYASVFKPTYERYMNVRAASQVDTVVQQKANFIEEFSDFALNPEIQVAEYLSQRYLNLQFTENLEEMALRAKIWNARKYDELHFKKTLTSRFQTYLDKEVNVKSVTSILAKCALESVPSIASALSITAGAAFTTAGVATTPVAIMQAKAVGVGYTACALNQVLRNVREFRSRAIVDTLVDYNRPGGAERAQELLTKFQLTDDLSQDAIQLYLNLIHGLVASPSDLIQKAVAGSVQAVTSYATMDQSKTRLLETVKEMMVSGEVMDYLEALLRGGSADTEFIFRKLEPRYNALTVEMKDALEKIPNLPYFNLLSTQSRSALRQLRDHVSQAENYPKLSIDRLYKSERQIRQQNVQKVLLPYIETLWTAHPELSPDELLQLQAEQLDGMLKMEDLDVAGEAVFDAFQSPPIHENLVEEIEREIPLEDYSVLKARLYDKAYGVARAFAGHAGDASWFALRQFGDAFWQLFKASWKTMVGGTMSLTGLDQTMSAIFAVAGLSIISSGVVTLYGFAGFVRAMTRFTRTMLGLCVRFGGCVWGVVAMSLQALQGESGQQQHPLLLQQ